MAAEGQGLPLWTRLATHDAACTSWQKDKHVTLRSSALIYVLLLTLTCLVLCRPNTVDPASGHIDYFFNPVATYLEGGTWQVTQHCILGGLPVYVYNKYTWLCVFVAGYAALPVNAIDRLNFGSPVQPVVQKGC